MGRWGGSKGEVEMAAKGGERGREGGGLVGEERGRANGLGLREVGRHGPWPMGRLPPWPKPGRPLAGLAWAGGPGSKIPQNL